MLLWTRRPAWTSHENTSFCQGILSLMSLLLSYSQLDHWKEPLQPHLLTHPEAKIHSSLRILIFQKHSWQVQPLRSRAYFWDFERFPDEKGPLFHCLQQEACWELLLLSWQTTSERHELSVEDFRYFMKCSRFFPSGKILLQLLWSAAP